MTVDGAPSLQQRAIPEGAEDWLLTALPAAGTARPPLDRPQRHTPMSTTVHPLASRTYLFLHMEGSHASQGKM